MSDSISRTEDDYAYCAECDHVEMCRWYPMYGCEFKSRPSAQAEYKELQDWKTDFKGFIDALDMPRDDYREIMEYIDEMPSVQPEIILCKDCKYWGSNGYCVYGSRLAWIGNYNDYCSRAERRSE